MGGEGEHADPLLDDVAAFLDRRALLRAGQHVLVGVSGGADSVALLAVLRQLAPRPDRGYRLTVAHLDHGLRDEAAADAAFVAELAARWQIPCVLARRDVRAAAERDRLSLETAARAVRYEFFAEVASRHAADAVAVGHNADDHAETVLFRIVRGTHLRGLAGIPAERVLAGTAARLIRPLLAVRREQILDFCRRRQLTWRQDHTNADVAYQRNFLRHEVLPLLRRLNPRADEALVRLAAAAGEVEQYLAERGRAALARALRLGAAEEGAGDRLVLEAAALAGEHAVVRTYALRAALERLGAPLRKLSADQLAELADLPVGEEAGSLSLPGGLVARRERQEVVVERAPSQGARAADWTVALPCPGEATVPDGRTVVCEVSPLDAAALEAHRARPAPGVELLDADRVGRPLVCRPRRAGDAFVPLGAPGRQTVGDFLTNRKLPRRRRDETLCICDEAGIVYLAPLRIADRVKISGATRNVLRIELRGA